MKQFPLSRMAVLLWICVILSGCGKKGAPVVPVIPRPLPVQGLSATVDSQGVTLSWTAPATYNTEKSLELDDIQHFVIHRKTEAPMTKGWDFATTNEGWSAAGKTAPIKHHKGALRTASSQARLFVRSQDELGIAAEQNRYIRLKLWTNNAKQGYIAFITTDDTNWDIEANLDFYPAVHTSYFRYRQAFSDVKLKAFPIVDSAVNTDQEYVIDMSTVPTWKGTIKQIGILLRHDLSDPVETELGLDQVEFVTALAQQASPYQTPPWLFLEDSEGWTSPQTEKNLFGGYNGVLYAQGTEPIMLFSAPGQTIEVTPSLQAQIRMQVTAGQTAYLWLRRSEDEVFPDVLSMTEFFVPSDVEGSASSNLIPFPLPKTAGFYVNTINIGKFLIAAEKAASQAMIQGTTSGTLIKKPSSGTILQVGLLFPRVESVEKRHILIDFLDFKATPGEVEGPALSDVEGPALSDVEGEQNRRWSQQSLPTPAEVERQLQARKKAQNPEFFIPYAQLPTERKLPPDTSFKLVKISPQHPEPAMLKDGMFFLKDTGDFVSEETLASLNYESRYTYQVDIVTQNNQTSEQTSTVTVDFFRIPQNPSQLQATPGDETITLSWERPVLTVDGQKIRHLSGYTIFRSVQAEAVPSTPLTRVPANTTSFTDTNLSNGITYYYAIQSVASTVSDVRNPGLSEIASAIPVDNIAPPVPKDVVGAYVNGVVRLYWNQEQSRDFGGFYVYRSEQENRGYTRITESPVLTASYQDTSVEPQKRYYYQVTAIDDETPPNESSRSDLAGVDTLPLD